MEDNHQLIAMKNNGRIQRFNIKNVAERLQTKSKRTDVKKTMIQINKECNHGFRLERRCDDALPLPHVGNNFYKNHSYIDPKIIRRPFKGPLYNEAGKTCIDLTQRYEPLENFVFQT